MSGTITLARLVAEAEAAVPRVPALAAARLIEAGALAVDVREAPELATGIVPGALHVPRGMIEFCADPASDFYLAEFSFARPVVLYCGTGERSALAGKTLLDMGYAQAFNLASFEAWARAGLPIGRPPPP